VAVAAALTRRTSRPATLIAARRLADDPKADFRAVVTPASPVQR
jgi:hypothetical protein